MKWKPLSPKLKVKESNIKSRRVKIMNPVLSGHGASSSYI
jgi:hypothetical protein